MSGAQGIYNHIVFLMTGERGNGCNLQTYFKGLSVPKRRGEKITLRLKQRGKESQSGSLRHKTLWAQFICMERASCWSHPKVFAFMHQMGAWSPFSRDTVAWDTANSRAHRENPITFKALSAEVLGRHHSSMLRNKVEPSRPWHLGIFHFTLVLLGVSQNEVIPSRRYGHKGKPVGLFESVPNRCAKTALIFPQNSCHSHSPPLSHLCLALMPYLTKQNVIHDGIMWEKLLILWGHDEVFTAGMWPTESNRHALVVLASYCS